MKISVIIPCYNYQNFVGETIQSVFEQSYINIECIVVNDGSIDKSLEILYKLKETKFPQLIILNKDNGGLSSARNAGIKVASGDYIAFIDADDLWYKDKILHQLEWFNASQADVVFSDYVELHDSIIKEHNETTDVDNPKLLDFIAYNPCRASASSVMLKKEVIQKIGYFDTNLRSLEDLDYWFRCSLEGFKFSFCRQKDVILRRHSVSMMQNNLKMFTYHWIVLEKQLAILDLTMFSRNDIVKPLRSRLGKMRWYAGNLKRIDLLMFTNIIGYNYLGFKYFNSLFIRYLITDFLKLIFK